jgi:excisionase family DNA binding protein
MRKNKVWWAMTTEWLSVEDIANELHVSIDTVRNWIKHRDKSKRLVAYKVGRDYRIKREDFNKFLEQRRIQDE